MPRLFSLLFVLCACTAAPAATLSFDDPFAGEQYYLDMMRFPQAWDAIYTQPRRGLVTVGVVDSGFETAHPDLGANLLTGINIVDGSSNIAPVHAHGTGTAGLPGASSGNSTGISQSAWTASVLPVRVSNRSDGAAYIDDIADAIRYAADHGARIINVSYGGIQYGEVRRAAKYAFQHGAVVFMSAGNDGYQTRWSNCRFIQAIASIGEDNTPSNFTTYGSFVDFAAPGEGIKTLYTNGGYASWNGTSFSSPIAASVGALVLVANPDLSPSQVVRILKETAIDLGSEGKDNLFGYGRPDALAAVEAALETRGKWAARNARLGNDPYVSNDWSDLRGLSSPRGEALVSVQGFMTGEVVVAGDTAASVRVVPEPATLLLVMAGATLVLRTRMKA
jgi:thermitase